MSSNQRVHVAVLSFVSLALLVPALVATPAAADWPGFQGDPRHTGRSDDRLADNLSALWEQRLDAPIYASPIVGDGRLFVATEGGQVSALDPATGKTLWSIALPEPVYGTPAYEGGRLYVATSTFSADKGDLHVLDARTGKTLAMLGDGKGSLGGPTVMAGTVFWGDGSGVMHAYETTGYTKLWTFKADLATSVPEEEEDEDLYHDDCCMRGPVNVRQIRTSPVVHEERVYFGAMNHMLFALDAAGTAGSEETTLSFAENLQDILFSSAGVDGTGDRLFVGSYDGRLYSMSTEPQMDAESCVKDDRRVHHPYPHSCSRYLYWTYNTDSRIHSSPAIGRDKVFFGDNDGVLHALWKNHGQSVWTLKTGGGIYSSPAVAANAVVVGSYDGHVYVVRDEAGGRTVGDVWSYEMPERVHASPAISGGIVYAASLDGTVVAIGDREAAPPPADLDRPPAAPAGSGDAASGTPDLTLGSVTLDPEFPIVGEPVGITVEVENAGGGDAGTVTVALYADGTAIQTDEVVLGAQAMVAHTFTYTATEEGPIQFSITVNEDGAVEESDAENNERRKPSFASAEALDLETAGEGETASEESPAVPLVGLLLLIALVAARRHPRFGL